MHRMTTVLKIRKKSGKIKIYDGVVREFENNGGKAGRNHGKILGNMDKTDCPIAKA